MSFIVLLKILTAIFSVGICAGLLARDHGLKGYRLLAMLMFCNGWWALCEFFQETTSSASSAEFLIRLASLGALPLGVLCMHAALEFSSEEGHPLNRTLPVFYVAVAILAPIHVFTDWVIQGAILAGNHWQPVLGPGVLLSYAAAALPTSLAILSRREAAGTSAPGGQKELARVVLWGVSGALAAATISILIAPSFGAEIVNLTPTLLVLVGISCLDLLRRRGHSLTSSQSFAREILDNLADGYVLVTEEGIVRDVNRSFLKMISTVEPKVIGTPVENWIEGLAEAGASLETARLMMLRTGTEERIPVVVSPSTESDTTVRRLGRAYLLRDRREVIALQRKLVASARLAAVGDLAKSISQSISEPVIRARQELEGLELDWQTIGDVIFLSDRERVAQEAYEEGAELIAESAEGIDRIFSILQEVRSLSEGASAGDLHPHALDEIVSRAIRVASVQASDNLQIQVRMDSEVQILCHASEIERVVINVVVNAIQALQEEPQSESELSVAVIAQGRRALLHVEDNGCGIEAQVLDRVFDPFFTTKPVGMGTGLGLAISYHIVKSHGGEIRISSEAGGGTSVAVEFPLAPQSAVLDDHSEREGDVR